MNIPHFGAAYLFSKQRTEELTDYTFALNRDQHRQAELMYRNRLFELTGDEAVLAGVNAYRMVLTDAGVVMLTNTETDDMSWMLSTRASESELLKYTYNRKRLNLIA